MPFYELEYLVDDLHELGDKEAESQKEEERKQKGSMPSTLNQSSMLNNMNSQASKIGRP